MKPAARKYDALTSLLKEMGSVLVAFSGGVDSTLLLKAAHDTLAEHAAAITIDAPFHSRREISSAMGIAQSIGVRHIVHTLKHADVTALEHNPEDRCYVCKKTLFGICLNLAEEYGFSRLVDGSNADDAHDYRPGKRALKELAVRSPLQEVGLTKNEIRELSRDLGLDTWDKPALSCLLTRFPHGDRITASRLAMVEEGEELLREMGFRQLRVRAFGDTALIELEKSEIQKVLKEEFRAAVTTRFRTIGFSRIALDLEGYRCGSMNLTAEFPAKFL